MKRTVVINEIEPAPLSLRAAIGLPTIIDFLFKDQDDAPYQIDLAAQIKIEPRTTGGNIQMFPAPSTDRLNGKARAVIPANTLTDPNGYVIRLVGTLSGGPALFASGVIIPYPAAGLDAVPTDVIDQIDIVIERGGDYVLYIQLWQDTEKTIPLDMTGSVVSASIEKSQTDPTVLADFVVTEGTAPSSVVLTLPQAVVDPLPNAAWWRLRLTRVETGMTTLAEGSVTVVDEI
jgi:hypothetical protein